MTAGLRTEDEAGPGGAPWWLHESDCVWIVEEGAVDIFATEIDSGGNAGTRHPLYRAFAGMPIMGIGRSATPADAALLAVPLPNARVRPVAASELARLGAGEERARVAELVAAWIGLITRGLPLPPAACQPLHAGEPATVAAGTHFCATERLMWIRIGSGTAAFMGEDGLEITAEMPALPLRRDVWCRALTDVELDVADEETLLGSGEIWSGVRAYSVLAIRHALLAFDRLNREESVRLQVKAARASRVMHEALSGFAGVARGERSPRAAFADDPLLACCDVIGQHLGVAFRKPPGDPIARAAGERVQEIAVASGVRTRQVALTGRWWREDNGALLAMGADGAAPCALLPLKGRAYEMHDGAAGPAVRVTAAIAQTLAPFATQFYRPFPPKAMKLADLARFALRGQRRDLTAIFVLGLLGGLLALSIPVATGHMVDAIIPSAQPRDAMALTAGLIAAVAAAQIFELVRAVAILRIEGKIDASVQCAVWDRVLALPMGFFRQYTSGDLSSRINGINAIRRELSGTTVGTLLSGVFALLNFILLFYYSATLAALAAVLTLLAVAVTAATGLVKLRHERRLAETGGRLAGTVFQYLTGVAKLRVNAAENRAFANWARDFTSLRQSVFRAENVAVADHTFFAAYSVLVNAAIFAVIGVYFLHGGAARMSTGEFVAFSAAFGTFFAALIGVAETALQLVGLVPYLERARPILDALPEVGAAKKHPGGLQGAIELVNVEFGYAAGQPILRDTSFRVRPGGFIALVGPSGSGKSTLFRLLLGFEKPHRGSIYYDNQDLADLDVHAVRRQLGVVLQSGQLMIGDIFMNIVGASTLTIDDAWEAARMVGLDEDIGAMPMGMHTIVSEGSSTLSAGQRQRILIARAIAHRPRLLLLDEATSALDNRTQAIVARSLERLQATRIVIAHRLSTIVNADRILVLQDGAIVQSGSYAELIGQEGPFADLAKRQIA